MKRLMLLAAAATMLAVTYAPAFAQVGSIQTPRHDRMVCENIADVRPANEAWLGLINKMKSVGLSPDRAHDEIAHGEVSKWTGRPDAPCGLIIAGKAALVREENVVDGTKYICVEIYANVASAEHYRHVVNKCHWTMPLPTGYGNEDGPAELAPRDVRERQQTAEDKLFEAYWRFAFVQYCHKVRGGYALIFVSDPEFERSETIAKAVAKNAIAADASLNIDKVWRQALDHNNGLPVSRDWCQRAYRELLELSPVGVFSMEKP
jgi:hypothetical protein